MSASKRVALIKAVVALTVVVENSVVARVDVGTNKIDIKVENAVVVMLIWGASVGLKGGITGQGLVN